MTTSSRGLPRAFRRALVFSALLHTGLVILFLVSPSMSRPRKTGLVQYVNFIGLPGGGGPGGGGGTVVTNPQPLPPPKKAESLRDLTVAEKVKPEDKSTMHYPTDKAKKPVKKTPEKKAVITKTAPSANTNAAADTSGKTGQQGGQGPGFGLKFGTGGGTGGTGGGAGTGGGGDQFGLSGFPFNYYLQIISDHITSNWFSSLVDPGVEGQFQAQVGFKIYRNGQIGDLKVEVSSGIEAFDISAQRAIQSSAPFPALPSEYDGQYLSIHLIFEHAK